MHIDDKIVIYCKIYSTHCNKFLIIIIIFRVGVHPIPDGKIKFEEELIKSGLEYTIICNGIFQEYLSWIGFDVKNKKATLYADGSKKLYTTSLSDVGKYTVETLKCQKLVMLLLKSLALPCH
jgi:hypothetical protein